MTDKKSKSDPENYHKMSVPFENKDQANESLRNFYADIEIARAKHKIPDILIVTKGSTKYEDGEIGQWMQHSNYGNSLNIESMAAYAYGCAQADARELINKLLAGKTT